MRASWFWIAVGFAIAPLVGAARDGSAQSTSPAASEPPSAERIVTLEQKLDAAERYIQNLRAELDLLKAGRPASRQGPAVSVAPAPEVARATPPPQPPSQPAPAETPTEEEGGPSPEQDRPVFTPAFLRQAQAVLIPKNRLEITPSFQYTYSDFNLLSVQGLDIIESIFIGKITVEKQRTHGLAAQLDARYGITDRLQASVTAPYRLLISQVSFPPQIQRFPDPIPTTTNTTQHLGDIEVGLSYHALRERRWLPDLIVGITAKTTTGASPFEVGPSENATGSGFWGIRGQATMVKVADPGILFGSASYQLNLEDDVNIASSGVTFDPGDVFQLSAGYAYALNPFLSLTTRIEGSYVQPYTIDGSNVDGTDLWLASLGFGVTYGINRLAALDFGFQIGITEDAPDFRFTLSVPFQFTLPSWDRIFHRHGKP
jgi:hypothetical protein